MNYVGNIPGIDAAALAALDARVAALEGKQSVIVAPGAVAGTSMPFTALPSGIKRISMHLFGVSSNGASMFQAQIGEAGGGFSAAGYFANVGGIQNSGASGSFATNQSAGAIMNGVAAAAYVWHGHIDFRLSGANSWTWHSMLYNSGLDPNNYIYFSTGSKVLAGVLDRIRLTTLNGTDILDAGSVGLSYNF